MQDDTPALPAHIEETLRSIAQLHVEHRRSGGPLQRLVDGATETIGRPKSIALATAVLVVWIGGNVMAHAGAGGAWDPPPFTALQTALAVMALYLTLFILATQRREDQLASCREQLALQLAILSDQKSAKIIALLEEIRRDSPTLRDRVDDEAQAMAAVTDHQAIIEAIRGGDDDAALVTG